LIEIIGVESFFAGDAEYRDLARIDQLLNLLV
jgi:hypothetical protein